MRHLTIGNIELELYDSPEVLPMRRFQRHQKYSMQEAQVGSDISGFDRHFLKQREFVAKKMFQEALTEMDNQRMSFYNIMEEHSYEALSFAILIKTFNGEPVKDYSDDRLNEMIDALSEQGLTKSKLSSVLDVLKKKFAKS